MTTPTTAQTLIDLFRSIVKDQPQQYLYFDNPVCFEGCSFWGLTVSPGNGIYVMCPIGVRENPGTPEENWEKLESTDQGYQTILDKLHHRLVSISQSYLKSA